MPHDIHSVVGAFKDYVYFFSIIISVAVNVAVNPSSNSFPMGISAPDWRWEKMCDVLDLVENKGLMFSSALWIACMRLPYGSST